MTMPDHLSDDALTDVIDGGPSPEAEAHLGTCRACSDRLAALRAAVTAVAAAPPPPRAPDRDAALQRALAVAGSGGPRRLPAPAPWMAVAAALALLLGAVAIVAAVRGGDTHTDAALSRSGNKTAADLSAGGAVDAGDLGDQRDAAALHTLLEAQLPAQESGAQAGPMAASGSEPAPLDSSGSAARPASPPPPATSHCVAEAREAGSGRLGALVLTGKLRWQGHPAVVLVFASPGQTSLGRRAFVMAQRDCQLLVAQSF